MFLTIKLLIAQFILFSLSNVWADELLLDQLSGGWNLTQIVCLESDEVFFAEQFTLASLNISETQFSYLQIVPNFNCEASAIYDLKLEEGRLLLSNGFTDWQTCGFDLSISPNRSIPFRLLNEATLIITVPAGTSVHGMKCSNSRNAELVFSKQLLM
jgi:hypothetical protein